MRASHYGLIDSGDGQKLEQFGDFLLIRPAAQALWKPSLLEKEWGAADATFIREGGNRWQTRHPLPPVWQVEQSGIRFKISPTDFGHVGLFPEHSGLWEWMQARIVAAPVPPSILNLFAYTGGATLAAAIAGAKVCHLDASQAIVAWARENAALNHLEKRPIRWIVDDALKFLERERKRKVLYDGILLDPPSFGRGNRGEVFKFERDLPQILTACRRLLSEQPLFFILSAHTPGVTPLVLRHLISQTIEGMPGTVEMGELTIDCPTGYDLPSGSFARWSC